MKLLLDQNLSPKLIENLSELFPNSVHVQQIGLDYASDTDVWEFARKENHIIVTKDADFHERSLLYGLPPKVVWIVRGNCSTEDILVLLKDHSEDIRSFSVDENTTVLILR